MKDNYNNEDPVDISTSILSPKSAIIHEVDS